VNRGVGLALQFFCEAKREALKAANPGVTFGEVGKLLGQAWTAATPEERAPFISKHEARRLANVRRPCTAHTRTAAWSSLSSIQCKTTAPLDPVTDYTLDLAAKS